MQQIRKRFGGLYWRLTISYVAVTVLAVVIVVVAILLPATMQAYQQVIVPWRVTELLASQDAPLLSPSLMYNPGDTSALQHTVSQIPEQIDTTISAANDPLLIYYLGVVNSQQQVIATLSPCAQAQATVMGQVQECTPQDPQQPMRAWFTAPILAVLGGDTRQTQWIALSSQGMLLAVPIHASRPEVSSAVQSVVGALVAVISLPGDLRVTTKPSGSLALPSYPPPPSFSRFLLDILWNHIQVEGLYVILLASAVGTITGLLLTRNVTRRLRRITEAAAAWSQGEFTVTVRDPTRDEIGQLGQDLNGMAEQLRALVATRHRMAVLKERQRWQRDLHDAVKQQLFAATMQIAAARACFAADTSHSYQHIVEAEHLAGQAQRELTTLIQAVRPDGLAGKPFAEMLDELCQQWLRHADIPIELQVEGQCDLPPEAEVALYRVVQEALANVMRHSAATRVTVRLQEETETVSLAVRDNGQGFDPVVSTAGLGLRSMRQRIADLGGNLVVATSPDGTQITARIPRRQEADGDA